MKKYLVLGGSSGIGLAIAQRLVKEDNRVVIVGSSKEKLDIISHKNIVKFQYDLSDLKHIEEIFLYCKRMDIRLDGMVYCAGIAPLKLLEENTVDLMLQVYNINFFAMIECCKYFYKSEYSSDGSKIVAIGSVAGHSAGYRQVLYGSSKAALVSATRLMAQELYNRRITINCVSPSATDTPMLNELRIKSVGLDEKIIQKQFLGIINKEKIADFVSILLGDLSDYITGNEYIYDAGALLK